MKFNKNIPSELTNRVLLYLIIVVAIVLRFYKLDEVPFTHDEFSALFRTQYDNLRDLIDYGVKGDGHPAGIQILLFYVVKLMGFNSLVLKLPFAIMGVLSVYFVFKISKKWFNETVALISASFIATLQFSVMYSQIIRPYISGLFFSLVMVYYWSEYIFYSNKRLDKNLLIFVFAGILCSYNHYFSLLFLIVAGLTGLFYIDKKRLGYYVLSGVFISLLFVPHLNIMLDAMKIKGLSWLGRPDYMFYSDYIKFIFHSSYFVGLIVLIIFFTGISNKFVSNKFRIISLIFFFSLIIIGFIYSILIAPILQFSVLIFSFPFIIIFLASFMKNLTPKINFILVPLILVINILSLSIEKKYYKVFYQSGYSEILKENANNITEYSKNITSIVASSRKITRYYLKNDNLLYSHTFQKSFIDSLNEVNDNSYIALWSNEESLNLIDTEISVSELKKILTKEKTNYIFYGWAHHYNSNILEAVISEYPYLVKREYFFNSEYYLYSRIKPQKQKEIQPLFSVVNGFEKENNLWQDNVEIAESIAFNGKKSCYISSDVRFAATFSTKLKKLSDNEYNNLSVNLKFYVPDTIRNAYLVVEIGSNNHNDEWYAKSLKEFNIGSHVWKSANLNLQINKVHFPFYKRLKVYIWNPNGDEFYIDDFSISVYPGNKNRFNY